MSQKIRGIRNPIPPGYLLGRKKGPGSGKGDTGLVKMSDFATKAYVQQVAQALPSINDGYTLQNQTGASAVPGGVSVSSMLDYVFGNPALQGNILYRDTNANGWKALATGAANTVLTANGAASNPTWDTVTALLDAAIGGTRGQILYRNATVWTVLAPGTAGYLLQTGGAGADPSWISGPAGSSGNVFSLSTIRTSTNSALFDSRGNMFSPIVTFTIDKVWAGLNAVSGHTYELTLSAVSGTFVVTSVLARVAVAAGSSGNQNIAFDLGGTKTLTAGTLYIVAVTDTGQAGNVAVPVSVGSTTTWPGLPMDPEQIATWGGGWESAVNSVIVGTTFATVLNAVSMLVRAQV